MKLNLKTGLSLTFVIFSLVVVFLIERFFPESEGLSFVAGFLIAFSIVLFVRNVIRLQDKKAEE